MNFKKATIDLFLIFILVTCISYGIKYKDNDNGKALAEFNIENRNMKAKSIEEIINSKEEDTYIFTALREEKGTITNKQFSKSKESNIVEITGNSSLLFNSTILFMDDKKGCLIDKSVAYALFGSYDVKGMEIDIEGKSYTIRDVINNEDGIAVIQSNLEKEMELLVLDITNKDERYIENFSTKYGFENNYTTNKFYKKTSNLISLILPLIIEFMIIINMLKLIKSQKNKLIKKIILIMILFVFIYFFYLIVNVKFKINYNIIPNEWSDFDYWGEMITDYYQRNRELLFKKKYSMDILLIDDMIKSIFCSIIAIIVFFILKNRIKIINIKALLKLLIAVIFI
ncbi:MAG: ABC transporter permease, partial [Clostridium sp.]|nr:ABC transporter permease [Clostridium sp.]